MNARCSPSLPLKLTALLLAACAVWTARAFAAHDARTAAHAAAFSVLVLKPTEGGFSSDDLSIAAIVSSTFELSSVKAQVDGREVSLAFSNTAVCDGGGGTCSPGWAGVLSLAGLPRGAKTLNVTATDVLGATGQAERHFTYDRPPSVSVNAPVAETVTGLTLRVKAACADDDPAGCASMSVSYSHPSNAPGTGGTILNVNASSIDQDVTLPAVIKDFSSDGQMLILTVRATDSAGQTGVAVVRPLYVQQRSTLVEVESFGGSRILDAQQDRVLLLENATRTGNVLKIRTRATGDEIVIPLTGQQVVKAGFLSPKGAVFSATDPATFSPNGRVYDWRDGALVPLTELFTDPVSSGGLKVKGDYALWDTFAAPSPSLLLRNLLTGATVEVAKVSGGPSADLAANGDVVYTLAEGRDAQGRDLNNIYRHRNGASARLTDDAQDFTNGYPITDGINVVYQRQPAASQTSERTLTLIDPAGARTDLGTMPRVLSIGEYQAAGGWVAFPRQGGGVAQVWTRSPSGDFAQVSFFGTPSTVSRLASNGELTFASTNGAQGFGQPLRLNLHQPGRLPVEVAAAGPNTFMLGGQWYAFLGRTLFRLPTASDFAPAILTDADTGRAVALDSVTHVREPFTFSSPNNFSADRRTRLLLFAGKVDWTKVTANTPLTARAEDAAHRVYTLAVEYAAPDRNLGWMADIVVRLPDEMQVGGDFWLTVNVGGFDSNRALVSVAPSP